MGAAVRDHQLPEGGPADVLAGLDGVDLLLPYQQQLLIETARHMLIVAEKSRRIGYTWAAAADAVLTAGTQKSDGGMDALYLGPSLDMAREFIDVCAQWARLFDQAVTAQGETEIFEDGADEGIKAFRIQFATGFEVLALTSRPRSLRGRQGKVILDEAAFQDDLDEVLKAALALLMWGGKVLVISTHDGQDNAFNKLIEDIRSGRRDGHVLRVTIEDALADGLYRRICFVTGRTWTAEGEAAWLDKILGSYGDAAKEELYCIPRAGGGKWLPRSVVEANGQEDIPVLRWSAPDGFVDEPKHIRDAEMRDWCERHLKPVLVKLDPHLESAFGMDFAMEGDLSVMWPGQIQRDLVRRTSFVVELRRCPVQQQEQVLYYILDRLPRWKMAALDAGGNGATLAQFARQQYGPQRVAEIKLSLEWYRVNMPPLKRDLEGRSFILPKDADIVADFGLVQLVDGVAKVPRDAHTKGTDGGQRHGDAAVAAALFHHASQFEAGEYGYRGISGAAKARRPFVNEDDRDDRRWRRGRGRRRR